MVHLSIGHLYTALHGACASAVARIIEAHGVDVLFVDLSMEERQEALETAEIDLLVSVWMPRDNDVTVEGCEVFGEIYLPQAVFASLSGNDVSSSWKGDGFSRMIVSEEALALAQSARSSRDDLRDLSLDVVGESALFQSVQNAKQKNDNPLIVTWQPHAVFHTDMLQILPDETGLLGGELKAQLILRPGLRQVIDDDLYDELAGMMLGNRVMSALDYAVSVDGIDPESAAESWQRGRLIGR